MALDRTRVVFDGSLNSVSLSVSNQNKQLLYLVQGWIEDEQGNNIQSPLMVLPAEMLMNTLLLPCHQLGKTKDA